MAGSGCHGVAGGAALEELAGATLGADLSVPGPPCLAPVAMLVPTVLGQRWDRVDGGCHPWNSSQGRGPGSTLDGLAPMAMQVPAVLSSGGWWVPSLGLPSLALVWAHPCLAGAGGHAVAGSSELGPMVGAIPGPAFAGAGRELTLTGWCRLASSRWLVPLTGVLAQAPCGRTLSGLVPKVQGPDECPRAHLGCEFSAGVALPGMIAS